MRSRHAIQHVRHIYKDRLFLLTSLLQPRQVKQIGDQSELFDRTALGFLDDFPLPFRGHVAIEDEPKVTLNSRNRSSEFMRHKADELRTCLIQIGQAGIELSKLPGTDLTRKVGSQ